MPSFDNLPVPNESRHFTGVDLYTNAADQTGGMLLIGDNVVNREGQLWTRSGMYGMFGGIPSSSSSQSAFSSSSSSSLAYNDVGATSYAVPTGPTYIIGHFNDSHGYNWLIFSANGGKIYKSLQASGYYTELTDVGGTSYSFTWPIDAQRNGDFLYIVDGNHDLKRLSLTGGFPAYMMEAPTKPPSIALTSTIIEQADDSTDWSSFPPLSWPGSNEIGNGANADTLTYSENVRFEGGGTSPSIYPVGWVHGGDSPGYQAANIKFDSGDGFPSFHDWYYPVPTYPAGECTVNNAQVFLLGAYANSTTGAVFNMQAFPEDGSVTSQTMKTFTDLEILSTYTVRSNANPFQTTDAYKVLTILSGTDVARAANYTVLSVNGATHVATINGSPGTAGGHADGIASLSLDAAGAAQQDDNKTLAVPPSALPGASQFTTDLKPTAANTRFQQVMTWSTTLTDFELMLFRITSPSVISGTLFVNTPRLAVVDVRIIVEDSPAGTLHLRANDPLGAGLGSNFLSGVWIKRDYTGTTTDYTDLAISGLDTSKVTSAAHPFQPSQEGEILVITSGTNWTPGNYEIVDVTANVATLSHAAASSTTATGGVGTTYGVRDYSQSNILSVGYQAPGSTPPGSIQWRFGFQRAGDPITDIAWSNIATYSADGSTFYCDVSTVDPTILAQTAYLYLRIENDLPITIAPSDLCTIGPITATGNLSQGLGPYTYYVTESAVIDSSNVIQSNPSPPSAEVNPTTLLGEASITLPTDCPVNQQTNRYNWYRRGGSWPDVRLIATVSTSASVAYGDDADNPFYSWNHTTRTLIDNTPDNYLSQAELMSFSRDPMPANAQCCAIYNGRFVEAVDNQIYISWLFNTDVSAPLYTTLVVNLDDPNYPVAGATLPVSPDVSDTIIRMVPFGTPVEAGNQFGGGLLILCKRSVWMLQGDNASNFSVKKYDYSSGVGLVAFLGVCRVSANEFVFMGPDRLHVFPPEGDDPHNDIGLKIKPQLYPVAPQTLQNQTAFSKSWMEFHDSKLLLGCPQPGQTANSVVWIWDTLIPGWLRWTGPSDAYTSSSSPRASSSSSSSLSLSSSSSGGPNFDINGMAITSAISLPPNSNGADYDLYLCGINGQIFRMIGTVDQVTPTSYSQPIPVTVQVHAMRPGFSGGNQVYYVKGRLEWYEIELVLTGTVVITSQAYTAGIDTPVPIAGRKDIQSYILANLGQPFTQNTDPGLIEGNIVTLTLSYVSSTQSYLRGVRGYVSATSVQHG